MMTTEQVIQIIVGVIASNGLIFFGIFKWGVIRAIEYTHMQRDIKELKESEVDQLKFNLKVMDDLKGISIKIDTKINSLKS